MSSKKKRKTEEQNGRVDAIQEMTPEAAQQVIDAAKRAKAERFQVEYQRLCAEYGLIHDSEPRLTRDGRTVSVIFVREIQER